MDGKADVDETYVGGQDEIGNSCPKVPSGSCLVISLPMRR